MVAPSPIHSHRGTVPPTQSQPPPTTVASDGDWTAVAAGSFHTCGRLASGHLRSWGFDDHGQLGNGAGSAPAASPVPVLGGRPAV